MSKKATEEKIERQFHSNRRRANRKCMKPVKWNGQEFESIRALARHHRLADTNKIQKAIKNKTLFMGHPVERIKK